MLDVFVNSVLAYRRSFTSLADAQAFFTDNPVDIGFGPGGPATVQLEYDLTSSQISSGFQFDYAFGSAAGSLVLLLVPACPVWFSRAAAFSAGGDGVVNPHETGVIGDCPCQAPKGQLAGQLQRVLTPAGLARAATAVARFLRLYLPLRCASALSAASAS
jgi:hypothetical protein